MHISRAVTLFGVVSLLLLAGCASISEEECLNGDWQEIGQRDGRNGRTADFIAKHAEACSEVGITPDRAAWEAGRQAGLTTYCTIPNAYDLGRQGRALSPVCPAARLPALDAARAKGLRYRQISDEIDDVRREMRDLRAEAGDDAAQRAMVMSQINMLQARIFMLEAQRRLVARP